MDYQWHLFCTYQPWVQCHCNDVMPLVITMGCHYLIPHINVIIKRIGWYIEDVFLMSLSLVIWTWSLLMYIDVIANGVQWIVKYDHSSWFMFNLIPTLLRIPFSINLQDEYTIWDSLQIRNPHSHFYREHEDHPFDME